jgi:hypothetical protein
MKEKFGVAIYVRMDETVSADTFQSTYNSLFLNRYYPIAQTPASLAVESFAGIGTVSYSADAECGGKPYDRGVARVVAAYEYKHNRRDTSGNLQNALLTGLGTRNLVVPIGYELFNVVLESNDTVNPYTSEDKPFVSAIGRTDALGLTVQWSDAGAGPVASIQVDSAVPVSTPTFAAGTYSVGEIGFSGVGNAVNTRGSKYTLNVSGGTGSFSGRTRLENEDGTFAVGAFTGTGMYGVDGNGFLTGSDSRSRMWVGIPVYDSWLAVNGDANNEQHLAMFVPRTASPPPLCNYNIAGLRAGYDSPNNSFVTSVNVTEFFALNSTGGTGGLGYRPATGGDANPFAYFTDLSETPIGDGRFRYVDTSGTSFGAVNDGGRVGFSMPGDENEDLPFIKFQLQLLF